LKYFQHFIANINVLIKHQLTIENINIASASGMPRKTVRKLEIKLTKRSKEVNHFMTT